MNLGVVKNMSGGASSSASRVSDQFPAGLRVLAVDDDPLCLRILERMLQKCHYEVTKCNRAEIALSLLRENKNGFDIVISDVHMPDMDGFKLLEHVGLEMDLPVIMMSADDSKDVVMKGVTHGACDYLIKPVRIEALKNIWQHVVRKKKYEWKDKDNDESASVEDGDHRQQKQLEDADYSSSANEGNWKSSKKRKEEEDETDERDDSSTLKKPRVVWSVELHQQFVQAVNQLGIDKAVPKKILELMNVPGLTRENVASHLQKYRLYLRRLSGVSQHQGGLNNPFMGHPEATYGPMSSFNGLELQALAATGQLPAQSLANLQAATLGRSATKSALPMPLVDQRNLFSFENPKLRFPEAPQQQLNISNKQINLLHGIPTTMEPKSFVAMNMQSNSSRVQQNNPLLMHMSQQTNGSQVSRAPLVMPSPIAVLSRNSIVPQASSMVDFSMHQNVELQNNSFPLMSSNSGMSTLTSKGMFHEEVNSDIKGSRGFPSSAYNIFGEAHQQKSQDWSLPSTFDHSSIPATLNVSQSTLVQQGISSTKKNGQNGNPPMGGPQHNSLLGGNLLTVKTEQFSDSSSESTFFQQQFGQDDLMSALLKQQGVVPVETEFGFDGYSPLDNLPV